MKAAVLTVSDGVAAGVRDDTSGDLLAELLAGEGYEVERRIVPGRARARSPRPSASSRPRCASSSRPAEPD